MTVGQPSGTWRRELLVPDLDFVAIGILHLYERIPRSKFASPKNSTAGTLDFGDREIDVGWRHQPEAKVRDAAEGSGIVGILLERNDVVRAGPLHLDGRRVPEVFAYAEHLV